MIEKLKKIIPRGSWVLVKPASLESRETKQGIILPASEEREQKAKGVVEAVGEMVKDIKKGDEVIYGVFAGETLKRQENGKEVEYKLLLDEDIIAFLK